MISLYFQRTKALKCVLHYLNGLPHSSCNNSGISLSHMCKYFKIINKQFTFLRMNYGIACACVWPQIHWSTFNGVTLLLLLETLQFDLKCDD